MPEQQYQYQYSLETQEWIDKATAGIDPYAKHQGNGFLILSVITNDPPRKEEGRYVITDTIDSAGHVIWRVVSSFRLLDYKIVSRFLTNHAKWDDPSTGCNTPEAEPNFQESKNRRANLGSNVVKPVDRSMRFAAVHDGVESVQTVCDNRKRNATANIESSFLIARPSPKPMSTPLPSGNATHISIPQDTFALQISSDILPILNSVCTDTIAAASAGCKVMRVNHLAKRNGIEMPHSAELFMGDLTINSVRYSSGQLFGFAKGNDELTIELDVCAAHAIVAGLKAKVDHKKMEIPLLREYSVNLSLPLIKSERVFEVMRIYRNGFDAIGATPIFELPEGLNPMEDVDRVAQIARSVTGSLFAIDDLFGKGSTGPLAIRDEIGAQVAWEKIDFEYFHWVRDRTRRIESITRQLENLFSRDCKLVIEGVESAEDKALILREIGPARFPDKVYIQGFGVQ